MNNWFQRSRTGPTGDNRFKRLSLERLENRDVPSTGSAVVATGIVQSTENFSNVITADYVRFLGRTPDATGFNFFLSQLQSGVSPQVIQAEFVSSLEYIVNHGGTSTTWVIGLYHDILGRLPSSTEVNFWMTELALGATPNQIGLAFTTSVEADSIFVTKEYLTLLNRAPDVLGLNFFDSALENGASQFSVQSTIVSSNEFIVDHATNSTVFIIGAYQDVLLRTPSSGEIAFWQAELTANGGL
jgi:uncharacterized protein DUF4214